MGRTPGAKNKPKGETVQTDTAERTEQTVADQPTSKGDVAIFQPARLPYHPAIEQRFQIDKGQWKVLVEAIFPAAKSVDAIVMALTYCKSRNLDPFKRPVHIVPMWDSARGGYVETVWPGISELRTTASRTKGYAGCDEAEFGPEKTTEIEGRVKRNGNWETAKVKVTFPDWCRLTVYRIVDGQKCKFVGPKVKWLETYATQGASDLPNKMWEERPEGQLEKCAEAAALRRAFPEEIGNELTAEEMIGRNVHDLSVDIPAVADAAATPNKDAGPPRAITAPKQEAPPADPEQARDGTPPARAPKPAAPKDDPISSGPPRTIAPKEAGPSDPGPKPHRIPGNEHTYESWAEKYCDLIKTSDDVATVYAWIDANSREFAIAEGAPKQPGPLTRLRKGKPSVYATVKKTTEEVMETLRDRAARAAQKAAKPKAEDPAPSDMGDGAGHGNMDDGANSPAEIDPPADSNPETILKWAKAAFATVQNADDLEAFFTETIEPQIDNLFPPDREEIMAEYKRTEKRLGID